MSEWTSIGVTQEQKEQLEREKPEGMKWGYWLLQQVRGGDDGKP